MLAGQRSRALTARMRARLARGGPVLSVLARAVLAVVFGYAGLAKIGDPQATVRAVRAYRLLPESVAVPFAHALPAVELALAVLLLVGLAVRLTGLLTALLTLVFIGGVASAAARGLKLECGCFGGGGATNDPRYTVELLRDAGLLALALVLARSGSARYALDPPPAAGPLTPAPGRNQTRHERAAAARLTAARERVRTRRRLHTGAAAALVVLAAVLGVAGGPGSAPPRGIPTPQGVTARGGVVVGSVSAPHHAVLYEDPQCPVCRRFELGSAAVLDRAVADGKIDVEYRMRSFLGPESVRAVAALGAAADVGVSAFTALRVELFTHQPAERSGGFGLEDLVARGRSVGLTSPSYAAAVRAQTYAAWARRTDDQASQDGNVGTPDLVLDGRSLPIQLLLDPAGLAAVLAALH